MRLGRPGAAGAGQTHEVRGIAVLRLALVPIALLTQSSHSDLSSDLFPWVIVVFGIYAAGSLLITFVSPRPPRLSVVPALIDLCAVALLVDVTGGEYSSLRFAFYVLPIAAALRLSPKLTASWAALSVIAYLAVTLPHPDTILPEDLGSLLEDSLSLLWVASAAVIESAKTPGSEIKTAVGSSLGLRLMAEPNRKSCISGTATIMPSVSRSRRIWMNSLPSIARTRAKERRALTNACPCSRPGAG